jgi:hypothetical protein
LDHHNIHRRHKIHDRCNQTLMIHRLRSIHSSLHILHFRHHTMGWLRIVDQSRWGSRQKLDHQNIHRRHKIHDKCNQRLFLYRLRLRSIQVWLFDNVHFHPHTLMLIQILN